LGNHFKLSFDSKVALDGTDTFKESLRHRCLDQGRQLVKLFDDLAYGSK
jgi:hypothetical protein